MNDLYQSAVSRDDFQRWLGLGTAPLTVYQGEKAAATLLKLEKNASVDYLYQTAAQDNSVSWNNPVQFCGVYDRKSRTLYLTKDVASLLAKGQFPFVAEAGPSMKDEITSAVNGRVESIIANDRNNLPIREITGWQASHDLEYYQNYGVKEDVIQQLFYDQEPDGRFHSEYELNRLPETAFIAYITDPELFVQTEAEQYIKDNQEDFLLHFLRNDALMAEWNALMQDTGNPIHRMKAITDAVTGCGAKTVTVTIQKDGQELTFKTSADYLKGHRSYYNSSGIPASDRREFERLFGRYAEYHAEDIVKITYGRNTIYEAPQIQSEELGATMQMGGM